jgi:type II secretory pathway pseudopilin PulG
MESYPPDVRRQEGGYAMAALLVAMAVMTVVMSAALPVWKTSSQREKEAELIFRGQQYARAIGLYQRRNGPGTLPPSVDILVDQKFLRRKYKDPITNDDFQLLSAAAGSALGQFGQQGQPGQPGQSGQPGRLGQPAQAGQAGQTGRGQQPGGRLGQAGLTGQPGAGGAVAGGLLGVVSKSTATSLRVYNNRNKYNEWAFVFTQPAQAPGAQQPGQGGARQTQPGRTGRDGGRGPVNPGGRGASPFGPGAGRGQGTPPPTGQPGGRRGF